MLLGMPFSRLTQAFASLVEHGMVVAEPNQGESQPRLKAATDI